MPAWLSPRIRLGVIAAVGVLVVYAVIPTTGETDSDYPPDSLAPSTVSVRPGAAPSPSTYRAPSLSLPQTVINALESTSPESHPDALAAAGGSTHLDAAHPATWSSLDMAPELLGEDALLGSGLLLPLPDCVGCDRTAPLFSGMTPFGGALYRPGGSGVAGAGGGSLVGSLGGGGLAGGSASAVDGLPLSPDSIAQIELAELGNRPSVAAGRDETHASPVTGHGRPEWANGDKKGPEWEGSGVVSVPEPSTLTLLSTAVFGLVIRAHRARKRRR